MYVGSGTHTLLLLHERASKRLSAHVSFTEAKQKVEAVSQGPSPAGQERLRRTSQKVSDEQSVCVCVCVVLFVIDEDINLKKKRESHVELVSSVINSRMQLT